MTQMSAKTPNSWSVISRNRTSIGAWEWILRRATTTVHVFDLPHGGGILAQFTDAAKWGEQDLRAEAHAARCYAQACDKIADLAESGRVLDARPVGVDGGHLTIKGADALIALRFYFEEPFSTIDVSSMIISPHD